jgi:hypothetical protein
MGESRRLAVLGRIAAVWLAALAATALAAQPAAATVPASISEHISAVAQWAYRGGTTRTFPSCESLCGELWSAEHAPASTDPFASELWGEIETLRQRVEVLPVLGSILHERELDHFRATRIGVRIGEAPGHVIWL